jgi:hypothetical protein
MEHIGEQELWSFLNGHTGAVSTHNDDIRGGDGFPVRSFLDLAEKVAELQFRNRDHVLFFRGQACDHRNNRNMTTLKPSLFRPRPPRTDPPDGASLTSRFQKLKSAEAGLVRLYRDKQLISPERLERQRVLRWSILQHYEVCFTPLLDVTQSLRIAASFASLRAVSEAFVFVLGVPNLSGAITASAEAGVEIVRLASVCPPCAVRPHIQEGYLFGEYPEMADYDQKSLYTPHEIDFGRRLVAKFCFTPDSFWESDTFPKIERAALYPEPDPLSILCTKVNTNLGF